MFKARSLFVASFLVIVNISAVLCQSLYKYDAYIDKIEVMANDKFMDLSKLRIKKYNRTTNIVAGEITLHMPFDDSMKGTVAIYLYQGNEYRKLIDMKSDAFMCRDMANDIAYWKPKAQLKTSFPLDGPCPVPAGKYKVWDAVVLNQPLPFEPPINVHKAKSINTMFDKAGNLLSRTEWYVVVNRRGLVWEG